MAEAVAAARRERELSKQAVEDRLGTLREQVREELDWKAKLRRDGARYAVAGAAILVVAAVIVARRRGASKDEEPDIAVTSLDDVAEQLRAIRKELAKHRGEKGPLWRSLALRAAAAAAAAGGSMVAKQVMERFSGPSEEEGPHRDPGR